MPPALDELQRIGLKLFLADAARVDPRELVPVFHRWIQAGVSDQLLIDVADYTHVPDGPGVVLVAHEGNLALDGGAGRRGLQYYRKQPADGPLASRLTALCRLLVEAAARLESEPALEGRLRFLGNELQIVANDRLRAPNDEDTFAMLRATLDPFTGRLYPGLPVVVTRNPDPRERLTVSVRADGPVTLDELSRRLGDP